MLGFGGGVATARPTTSARTLDDDPISKACCCAGCTTRRWRVRGDRLENAAHRLRCCWSRNHSGGLFPHDAAMLTIARSRAAGRRAAKTRPLLDDSPLEPAGRRAARAQDRRRSCPSGDRGAPARRRPGGDRVPETTPGSRCTRSATAVALRTRRLRPRGRCARERWWSGRDHRCRGDRIRSSDASGLARAAPRPAVFSIDADVPVVRRARAGALPSKWRIEIGSAGVVGTNRRALWQRGGVARRNDDVRQQVRRLVAEALERRADTHSLEGRSADAAGPAERPPAPRRRATGRPRVSSSPSRDAAVPAGALPPGSSPTTTTYVSGPTASACGLRGQRPLGVHHTLKRGQQLPSADVLNLMLDAQLWARIWPASICRRPAARVNAALLIADLVRVGATPDGRGRDAPVGASSAARRVSRVDQRAQDVLERALRLLAVHACARARTSATRARCVDRGAVDGTVAALQGRSFVTLLARLSRYCSTFAGARAREVATVCSRPRDALAVIIARAGEPICAAFAAGFSDHCHARALRRLRAAPATSRRPMVDGWVWRPQRCRSRRDAFGVVAVLIVLLPGLGLVRDRIVAGERRDADRRTSPAFTYDGLHLAAGRRRDG